MKRNESNVIMTVTNDFQGVNNTYRLIKTGELNYSLFLTSIFEGKADEEYCPNFAKNKEEAQLLLNRLVQGGVTACTLNDTVRDIHAELAEE